MISIYTVYGPAVPLIDVIIRVYQPRIFRSPPTTMAKTWKPLKYSSMRKWIIKNSIFIQWNSIQ